MLYKETVERKTFELLKDLMQDNRLNNFNLAGGTALALYMGHRKSIDLDLFTPDSFNAQDLEQYLIDKYNFQSSFLEKDTLKGSINDIKIDCITHNYPYLQDTVSLEGIRLYSLKDIVAMKLSAIADNGTRVKDFIDIAFLSSRLSLTDMLDAYEKKFPNSNKIRPLKGLTFFQDIQFEEPIQLVDGKFKWESVEKRLREMVKKPTIVFSELVMGKVK